MGCEPVVNETAERLGLLDPWVVAAVRDERELASERFGKLPDRLHSGEEVLVASNHE